MSDEVKKTEQNIFSGRNENEIDLLELVKTIWKGRKFVAWIVVLCVLSTFIISFFMTSIYTARAIIKPTSPSQSGGKLSTLASQFGGLATLAGIAMPSSASSTEIVNLLKSNILKKEVIENNQLLPILFSDRWDNKNNVWKRNIFKKTDAPTIWDGIRELDDIVKINYNMKEDIITISVDFSHPEMAAK
jgi:uncharacterized protein involved in exopolysaccharide biosynthesis